MVMVSDVNTILLVSGLLGFWKCSDFASWLVTPSASSAVLQSVLKSNSADCSIELRRIIEIQDIAQFCHWRLSIAISLLVGTNLLWLVALLWLTRCCRCCGHREEIVFRAARGPRALEDSSAGTLQLADRVPATRLAAPQAIAAITDGLASDEGEFLTPLTRKSATWRKK